MAKDWVDEEHVLALIEALGLDPAEVSRLRIEPDRVTVERDIPILRDRLSRDAARWVPKDGG